MSIQSQAEELIEAYDPLWATVVGQSILSQLPKDEWDQVTALLYNLRLTEIHNALAYAKVMGNPRRRAKFLAGIEKSSNVISELILSKIASDPVA